MGWAKDGERRNAYKIVMRKPLGHKRLTLKEIVVM
jgi:hypothetical protein